MSIMRKTLMILAVASAALSGWLWSAPAGAATVTAKATITCTTITVDPPSGSGVTFSGTVNGTPYTVTAAAVPGTHNSTADIDTLTTGTGPLTIVATPDFTVPENPYGIVSGPGVTVTVTLTCHTPPTTTTSTTSSTSSTTSSTTSTTTSTMPPTMPPSPPRPVCGSPGQLPCTGTNTTVPGALVGGTAIAAGAALVVGARRRRPVR